MSVLIKGMEMPKNCLECVFYRAHSQNYDYCCISSTIPKGYIPDDCPLIELPDHGDLIDGDDPVKHGHWEDENMDDQVVARCSVCNTWDTTRTPYCPHCGAYMLDKEEE